MIQIRLRCRNASGSSQPRDQVLEFSREEENVTEQIVKVVGPIFFFRREHAENVGSGDTIARISMFNSTRTNGIDSLLTFSSFPPFVGYCSTATLRDNQQL